MKNYINIENRIDKFSLNKDSIKCDKKLLSQLRTVSEAIKKARQNNKLVILMMGGHPIKVGLSKVLIDLLRDDYITDVAMNGACMIHDFEVGYCGTTSEDVEKHLYEGNFGNAEQTGRILNRIINFESENGLGKDMSEILGNFAIDNFNPNNSVMANSENLTIHLAIGTDFIHCHHMADGGKMGVKSFRDFKLFIEKVCEMDGGVIINLGSAVILPEILLKSLSVAMNRDRKSTLKKMKKITTVNLDMLEQYRSINNVIKRPQKLGASGIDIRAKHQESIPILYTLLNG